MAIVTNDNFNINAPKVIDDRYSTAGVTPYASTAAANAAIALTRRAIGLTVNIAGVEYWYKSGITDPDLVVKSSGSTATLPIVRNVYLVQDASDAAAMGGVANNVYSTFQTAYTAANALQLALGGSNVVVIKVGNTTAATVGNVTLTANWNRFVFLSGNGIGDSVVGNITGVNAAGNGFSIGSSLAPVNFSNIFISNLVTNATGAAGNSGSIGIIGYNLRTAILDTSITNGANTTGNGGSVTITTIFNNTVIIASIVTSSQSTTSNAGAVNISASNVRVSAITTANNNLGGGIAITSVSAGSSIGVVSYLSSALVATGSNIVTLINCSWTTLTAVLGPGISTISNGFAITSTSITNNGTGLTEVNITNSVIGAYTTNTATLTRMRSVSGTTIASLGDNSRLMCCTLVGGGASPTINNIGTGCKIMNCTIEGGTFGIDNSSPVTVDINVNSTYIENGVGPNITLI